MTARFLNILIFFLVLISGSLYATISITANPSSYSTCPSNIYGSCTGNTYLGGTIHAKYYSMSQSNNEIKFRIKKCNSGAFGLSGTMYIKDGNSVCGNIVASQSYNSGPSVTYVDVTIPLNYWGFGARTFTIVMIASNGDPYWGGSITLTKTGPDLVVGIDGTNPNSICPSGGVMTVDYTITNQGVTSVPSGTKTDFYLSSNSIYSTNDTYLTSHYASSIAPSGFRSYTGISLSLPSGIPSNFYIIAVVDPDNTLTETNENNNTGSSSQLSTAGAPSLIAPASNAIVSNLSPLLEWTSVPNASAYAIVVRDLGGSVLIAQNVGSSTSFQVPSGILSYDIIYKWTVGVLVNGSTCNPIENFFRTPCTDSYEPNNTGATATTNAFSTLNNSNGTQSISSYLVSTIDVDYYGITVNTPGDITINLTDLPDNYELELWPTNGGSALAWSTNSGSNSEQITYYHSGGATTYWIKVYSYNGQFSCTNDYDLGIVWNPNVNGTNLELTQNITSSPAPGVKDWNCYFQTQLKNTGAANWSGDIQLEILNSPTATYPMDVIKSYQGLVLTPNQVHIVSHTSTPITTVPGFYWLRVRYKDAGSSTWNTLSTAGGTYPNPASFQITESPIKLNGAITVSPVNIYENGQADFSVVVKNYSIQTYNGEIALQLLNANMQYVDDMDLDPVSLAPNAAHTLTYSNASFPHAPGNYFLQVVDRPTGGNWKKSFEGSFTNPKSIVVQAIPNSITVLVPNGGQSYGSNQAIPILWEHTGTVGNVNIELVDVGNSVADIVALDTPNDGVHNGYTVPNCLPSGQYRIKIYEAATNNYADYSNSTFNINSSSTNCTCTLSSPSYANNDDGILIEAANFLCSQGIISQGTGDTEPYDDITRGELAKMLFLALYGGNNVAVPTDAFPSPFLDLQQASAWYYRFAKCLAYLEYNDGRAPFDMRFESFRPDETIERKYVVKALLETFNVQEDGLLYNPFTADVTSNTENYSHIVTAADLCIIQGNNSAFRPDDNALRGEVMIMIYRLLAGCDALAFQNPTPVVTIPTPAIGDFFCPGNHKPSNLARRVGVKEGNFSNYTQTSYAIPGVKLPLVFGFQYESYLSELPENLFPLQPLGKSWTHSYNSHIIEGVTDVSGVQEHKYLLVWPTGQMEMYDRPLSSSYPHTCQVESDGVYNTFTRVSANTIEVKTKGQTIYTYTKKAVSTTRDAFLLTKIRERNGHEIVMTYQLGVSGAHRIATVKRELGNSNTSKRTLTFSYQSGTNFLEKIEIVGLAGTTVMFSVNADDDLVSYTDRMNSVTEYKYIKDVNPSVSDDDYEKLKHLLFKIKLPKGNEIVNTYDKRKLNSTQTNGGNLLTQIDIAFNYDDPNQQMTSTIKTVDTQNGNQVVGQSDFEFDDDTGLSTCVTRNYDEVCYTFGNPNHKFLPTIVRDGNLKYEYAYDANGNVEDIEIYLHHTNPTADYAWHFSYNLTYNNLTAATDPKGNTVIYNFGPYQAEGLVQSVTDQEGYTTTYQYYLPSDGQWLAGALKHVTSAQSITSTMTYDDFGNLITHSIPGNIVSTSTYDDLGRPDITTTPNGNSWDSDYLDNGLLDKVTNPYSKNVDYGHDANYNVTTIKNERGFTTTLDHYTDTDLLKSTSLGGNMEQYEYYSDGRLKKVTKADGTVINLTYVSSGDGIGQIQNDDYATFTYDGEQRVKTITRTVNGSIYVTTYTYDVLDRVIEQKLEATGNKSYTNINISATPIRVNWIKTM